MIDLTKLVPKQTITIEYRDILTGTMFYINTEFASYDEIDDTLYYLSSRGSTAGYIHGLKNVDVKEVK